MGNQPRRGRWSSRFRDITRTPLNARVAEGTGAARPFRQLGSANARAPVEPGHVGGHDTSPVQSALSFLTVRGNSQNAAARNFIWSTLGRVRRKNASVARRPLPSENHDSIHRELIRSDVKLLGARGFGFVVSSPAGTCSC
jgi:hypothetical protein